MKAVGLLPRVFICLSVFGTRDEALALVLDMLLQTQYDCKHHSVFVFYFFSFLFFLDRWQVKVHVSVKFPAEVDSLWMYIFKRFDADCKIYHSLAHPQKSLKIARKHIWRPKKEDTMVMCQRPFEKSERLMITECLIKN